MSEADAAEPVSRGLEEWVAGITENELPLFAQTLNEISAVAADPESSAADLARSITADIAMSVRLLRIANSPLLNPQNRDIDSISNAVVLMGFDAVRDLAICLSLVGTLDQAAVGDRLVRLVAHAFHAGSQAQRLSCSAGDRCPEETFVAGLLLNVGEVAFWSRPRPEGRRIDALMARGIPAHQAEREVLGFTLRQLSARLADAWRMGGLLRACLAETGAESPRSQRVLLGDQIAGAVERDGWKGREAVRLQRAAAKLLGLPEDDVQRLLREATRQAARMAGRFGVQSVERMLTPPEPPRPPALQRQVAEGPAARVEPDPHAQLAAMRKIHAALQQPKPDPEGLMAITLEGIRSGIGMDRVLFAAPSPNRVWLKARYAVGADQAALLRDCVINVGPDARNLFRVLLETRKAIWVDDERRQRLGDLITEEIDAWALGASFFAMPVFAGKRAAGLLYADRARSGGELDEEAFSSFVYFGEQAGKSLERA